MATWIRSGTCSVTNGSTTVTFTGVNLLTANARIGDEFQAPDGNDYEIASITSATEMELATNYLGGTTSGQSYAIKPTRGIIQSLYTEVTTLISTVEGHINGILSGLFSAGSVGSPSIAKTGDTNTGLYWPAADQIAAAAGGVQGWLLSSTALTLPLPVTASGNLTVNGDFTATGEVNFGPPTVISGFNDATESGFYQFDNVTPSDAPVGGSINWGLFVVRRNNANNLYQQAFSFNGSEILTYHRGKSSGSWTPWRKIFDAANILGTVSESSGVPTGAIIEQGSNANGKYVRFADGTQICWNNNQTVANVSTALGQIFESPSGSWTFPAVFTSPPAVSFDGGDTRIWGTSSIPGATSCAFRLFAPNSNSSSQEVRTLAVGKWY